LHKLVKTVLVVPGFKDHERDYKEVLAEYRKKGYFVRFIPIDWNETTLDHWYRQALAVYVEYDPREVILVGHSFGAIVALLLAAYRNPWRLHLLSLSGRFAEDIPYMKPGKAEFLGPEIMEAFARYRFEDVIPRITCKTILFIGGEEYQESPDMAFRVHETHHRLGIQRSRIVKADGAGHDPTHHAYLEAIACWA
jgi:pimeloyl-ACP methyl ester carboxylesterase